MRGWSALAQHATRSVVRKAALALVVRGLDLPREAREAHEPAAAFPPTPKGGSPHAVGSHAAGAATAERQRREAAQRGKAVGGSRTLWGIFPWIISG